MLRTATDHVHLTRAIELAGRGAGRTSPNPVVGAVVARNGDVLGEGWHDHVGGPHASPRVNQNLADDVVEDFEGRAVVEGFGKNTGHAIPNRRSQILN